MSTKSEAIEPTAGRFFLPLLIACGLGVLILGGCMQTTGDLGRAKTGFTAEVLSPLADRTIYKARGGVVSDLPLADQERVLNAQLWRFYRPPRASGWAVIGFDRYDRKKLLSGETLEKGLARYYKALASKDYRSTHTRYRTIVADIDSDLAVMPKVLDAICAVRELDRKRGIAAASLTGIDEQKRIDVNLRRRENLTTFETFARALEFRYESYSFALKQLLLDDPDATARNVDTRLSQLGIAVSNTSSGYICANSAPSVRPPAPAPVML